MKTYKESDLKEFATQWLEIPETFYDKMNDEEKYKLVQSGPYARFMLYKATDEFGRELKKSMLPLFGSIKKTLDRIRK